MIIVSNVYDLISNVGIGSSIIKKDICKAIARNRMNVATDAYHQHQMKLIPGTSEQLEYARMVKRRAKVPYFSQTMFI